MPDSGSKGPFAGHCVEHDGPSACRFAGNGHLRRISAKLGNVCLHPVEGKCLVKKARVNNALALDLGGREKPKCSQLRRKIQVSNAERAQHSRRRGTLTRYWIETARKPLLFALMISDMSCVPSSMP